MSSREGRKFLYDVIEAIDSIAQGFPPAEPTRSIVPTCGGWVESRRDSGEWF